MSEQNKMIAVIGNPIHAGRVLSYMQISGLKSETLEMDRGIVGGGSAKEIEISKEDSVVFFQPIGLNEDPMEAMGGVVSSILSLIGLDGYIAPAIAYQLKDDQVEGQFQDILNSVPPVSQDGENLNILFRGDLSSPEFGTVFEIWHTGNIYGTFVSRGSLVLPVRVDDIPPTE